MSLHPMDDAVEVRLGRFRPFVTYEGGIAGSGGLPMMERSLAARKITGAYYPANFGWRDLGALVIIKKVGGMADLWLSVTNGVGGGGAGGGSYYRGQLVRTNDMGDAMYSVGVVAKPVKGLRLNASYSINKHDDVALSDGTVPSFDRSGYSAGFEFKSEMGLWLDGEYMFFERADKDASGETELKGWYVRAGYWVMPKTLQVTARYEMYEAGKTNSTEDKGMGLAIMYKLSQFMFMLEYYSFDGEAGSSYTDEDPTTLRGRFQVAF